MQVASCDAATLLSNGGDGDDECLKHGCRVYDPGGGSLNMSTDQLFSGSDGQPPCVLWDIEKASAWGKVLPPSSLLSLPYARQHRGSPVIRDDAMFVSPHGDICRLQKSLLDSGSTTYSFVSPSVAQRLSHIFPIKSLRAPVSVRLGDNKTTLPLSEYILAPLVFQHEGREHRGVIQFYLFESGYDVIVGMPDILRYFATFLCAQILAEAPSLSNEDLLAFMTLIARHSSETMSAVSPPDASEVRDLLTQSVHSPSPSPASDYVPTADVAGRVFHSFATPEDFDAEVDYALNQADLKPPWSQPVVLTSPEDAFDVDPALHYLNKPHSEHVTGYFATIESRTEVKEFLQLPAIRDALFSEKYLDIFCPTRWLGINPASCPEVLPVELEMLPTLPPHMRVAPPPIAHRLQPYFDKEWDRLTSYMWFPTVSAYACALLAVPKWNPDGSATCRVAGDFRPINVYIRRCQENTDDPHTVATAISRFKYKADFDLRNAFHSMPLSERSSNYLAVQHPNGQSFRPKFMPEGCNVASGMFQKVMRSIFQDFIADGWFYIIIDNISFGGDSLEELADRTIKVLDRCMEANLILKYEKTFHCQRVVKFFGYEIGHNYTRMDEARIKSILDIPMPTSLNSMRSFLGTSGFFMRYTPDFSRLRAPLDETIKGTFDWNDTEAIKALVPAFEAFKQAMAAACSLFRPDFKLPFLVRCDASVEGIGAVLLQQDKDGNWVPIAFCSRKFSDVARRWSTWDQEAFSIFFSVTQAFRPYLWGKKFVVENDHRNLQWLEASTIPKIVRWRLQLQEYDFMIRHIPGKEQVIADFFSRVHMLGIDSLVHVPTLYNIGVEPSSCYDWDMSFSSSTRAPYFDADALFSVPTEAILCQECGYVDPPTFYGTVAYLNEMGIPVVDDESSPGGVKDITREAFEAVHNARIGHHGVGKTYQLLHRLFPGHKITVDMVREMVYDCAWCQKLRADSNRALEERQHHLETTAFPDRGWVGVDVLDMVKAESGNSSLVVFVVHDTKFVKLYPIANNDAITIARCAYLFASAGRYKGFVTDPGSSFTTEVLKQLNSWFDMFHKVSLVDRHESCGVEGTNRIVLEHTKALVQCERAVKFWDQPEYLQTVENIINRYSDFETGLSPNELTYGSEQMLHYKLLDPLESVEEKHEYVRRLNEYLVVARSESEAFHRTVLEKRARDNVGDDFVAEYQPDDYVLFKPNPRSKAHKLVPTLLGPYQVISQERGEILCRQVATGVQRQFHITRVYPFTGTKEEAFDLACRDNDQFGVKEIIAYRGDPVAKRKFMTFLVIYSDGDRSWVQYCSDLYANNIFQDYITAIPELKILRFSALEAGNYIARSRRLAIPESMAPKKFLIDLRVLDFTWYDSLKLPHSDTVLHLLETHFQKYTNKSRTRAEVYLPAFDEILQNVDHFWFEANATRTFLPDGAILVSEEFLVAYPQILGKQNVQRQRILEQIYSPVTAGSPANRRGIFRPDSDSDKQKKKPVVVIPRSSPRVMLDDHLPNMREKSSSSPSPSDPVKEKYLVPAVSSRRYQKEPTPSVGIGRSSLRQRHKEINNL